MKHRAAVPAGDGDLTLAAGNTEHLLAAGTLEVNVLPVAGLIALALEPVQAWADDLQKGVVLRPAAAVIPAESAEYKEKRAQCGHTLQNAKGDVVVHKHLDDPEDEKKNGQENIELVIAVTPVHQAAEKIAYHKMCAPIISDLMLLF